MQILESVSQGECLMISSDVLQWEIQKHPDPEKRAELFTMLRLAQWSISFHPDIAVRAEFLTTLGFRSFDALHLASAEKSKANCLLTTDDKLLKLAAKQTSILTVPVMNPVQWIWNQLT